MAPTQIVVSGRQQDKGEALVKELKARGAEAEFVKADVRYEKEVSALIDRVVSRFGRLDIAVNNAGVVTPRTLDLEDARPSPRCLNGDSRHRSGCNAEVRFGAERSCNRSSEPSCGQ